MTIVPDITDQNIGELSRAWPLFQLALPVVAHLVNCAYERGKAETLETAQPLAVPNGWMPIETAPKNMKILASYKNRHGYWRTVTACYHTQLPSFEDDDTENEFAPEGWYEESDSSEVIYLCADIPTHWMPLPAAPIPEAS